MAAYTVLRWIEAQQALKGPVSSADGLTQSHKREGMLKVAEKHEREGRPGVAKKIREKSKKFQGDPSDVDAAGTSEGARKGWEGRQHPAAGSFKVTGRNRYSNGDKQTLYRAGWTDKSWPTTVKILHDGQTGRTMVHESGGPRGEHKVFDGSHENAVSHLKNNYGIDHDESNFRKK